jgi:hypothetical protein
MISTRDLSEMPDIEGLRKLSQSLAVLDAIHCPEWEYRYYSFNEHWSPEQAMASMRNGEGDDYFALFTTSGVIMKGFVVEALMSPYATEPPQTWPGVLENVPEDFIECFLREPAFEIHDVTFCIWRKLEDNVWKHGDIAFPTGPDPDGSRFLLGILDGNPKTYQAWAEDYYERPIDLIAVSHIYEQKPLTLEVIQTLNTDVTLHELAGELEKIGYPGGISGLAV